MVVLAAFFIVYFLLLVIFLTGWNRAMQEQPASDGKETLISVVIPVRNEQMTILKLLENLSQQEYGKFEVIVVNDQSEDETIWVVTQFGMRNLKVIHNKGKGKKSAITTGVRHARGSVIVTTDADCSVSNQWLRAIHAHFHDPAVMMVFGGVRMVGEDTFLDALQSLEFSSLIGSGASAAALGTPVLCNGANLAFRKRAFSEVDGYEGNFHTPSGDDEFLMRKINARYKTGVRFVNDPSSVVTTQTQGDVNAFFNQRVRWASKWRYNSSLLSKGLAVLVVLFQVVFIINWFLIFTPLILQALFLLAIKIILEAAFLLQVCRFLRTRWNWLAFLSLQILYPLYTIIVSLASFVVPFQWKNRVFKPGLRFP